MKILSIGEVLWDMLPSGRKVGGAPANFAFHCMQLGAEVQMLSRVGNDELGKELIEFYQTQGLSTEFIAVDGSAPTGTVGVELSAEGQPKYTIHENVAWDKIEAAEYAIQYAQVADAVYFGSLASRNNNPAFQTIQKLTALAKPTALRILDMNLRDPFVDKNVIGTLLQIANILKLNDEELPRIANMFGIDSQGLPADIAQRLIDIYHFQYVVVTCGSNGSYIFADKEEYFSKSRSVKVVDTVGAGDSFTAMVVVGLLSSMPVSMINERASDIAAYVCTQSGPTPTIKFSDRSSGYKILES